MPYARIIEVAFLDRVIIITQNFELGDIYYRRPGVSKFSPRLINQPYT